MNSDTHAVRSTCDLEKCIKTAHAKLRRNLTRGIVELHATNPGHLPCSTVAFYRDFVSQSVPVVIRGFAAKWPAVAKWRSHVAMINAVGPATPITVALTPNGRADAVTVVSTEVVVNNFPRAATEECGIVTAANFTDPSRAHEEALEVFLEPMQLKCPFATFMTLLRDQNQRLPFHTGLAGTDAVEPPRTAFDAPLRTSAVVYAQFQNSSLDVEFSPLRADIKDDVEQLGTELFGCSPDAANVWIGSSRSVTTMHQDWYENLYAVVCGTKRFVLVPPWESTLLGKRKYKSGKYVASPQDDAGTVVEQASGDWLDARFRVAMNWSSDAETPWLRLDPSLPPSHPVNRHDAAGLALANVLTVDVGPGDVLYLPATWFHQVEQLDDDEGKVVAINYWFDMQFGPLAEIQPLLERTAGRRVEPSDDDDESAP